MPMPNPYDPSNPYAAQFLQSQVTGGSTTPTRDDVLAAYLENPELGVQMGQQIGMTEQEINAIVAEGSRQFQAERAGRHGLFGDVSRAIGDVGEFTKENPAVLFAAPFITAAATGAFGAGAGGGAAGGSATTYPYAGVAGPSSVTPIATGGAGGGVAGAGAGVGAAVKNASKEAGKEVAGGGFRNFFTDPANWLPHVATGVNALLGVDAADDAADAQVEANQAAIDESRRQFDTTREDLMPWMTAGRNALTRLENPRESFETSPGYEFIRGEGTRDIGNTFAAKGGSMSGNALRRLTEFNSGLAAQDFDNWWRRQAGVAGVGQGTAVNIGHFGANNAANTGNYLTGQGAARASGVLNRNATIAGGVNRGVENYLYRRRTA